MLCTWFTYTIVITTFNLERPRSHYARKVGKRSSVSPVRPTVHTTPSQKRSFSKTLFTITAEIHARSLVNFYRQYADRHMNLKFM